MASPAIDRPGLLAHAEGRRGPLIDLYRRLHRHPELGLRLPRTQQAVLDALRPLPIEVLMRADMDALPLTERTGLPHPR